MAWCYGLVQIEGDLVLCEVYFKKKKVFGYAPVTWKDINAKKTSRLVLQDLESQLSAHKKFRFKEKDFEEPQKKVKIMRGK